MTLNILNTEEMAMEETPTFYKTMEDSYILLSLNTMLLNRFNSRLE
jgi:hypothetical protein